MRSASLNSAATTNAQMITTTIKAGASVHSVIAYNAGAGAAYLKLYNTNKTPVVGTDTPAAVFAIPAAGNAIGYTGDMGLRFNLGLGVAITGGAADTDTTAVAASQVKATIAYL